MFNVIIFIISIIISINLSKFLKIQTKSSLLGPIQQNGLQAYQTQISLGIDPCRQQRLWPYSVYIQPDLSLACLCMNLPILARVLEAWIL